MKKAITLLLSLYVAVSFICVPAYADNARYGFPTTRYQYALSATSTLSISNGTATCTSELSGGSSVTKIVGEQYLQKYEYRGNGWQWYTVDNGAWTKTVNGTYLLMSNTKSSLDKGKYRLRTVFYVYSGTNYETIEKISGTVTI